ncbi:MAG: hypothetical protein Q7N50_12275 [Armatimonadota bacterium]|nr:hypothetical protein [Armatimonadota bacterium]
MREILHFFIQRFLRLIGGLMVFTSISLLVFMLLVDLIAGITNPYLGIITYMILPTILGIGLILVPLDSFLRRRRIAAGRPDEPFCLTINFCEPRQRNLAYFFGIASMFILVIATIATYKAIEFMDTITFCGLTCHRIMRPEHAAFVRSPHAGGSCVECHIGPGAPWFVKAKLTGIPQVIHYTLRSYERPVPTPVAALRPSRDTCENCHWPEQFYGNSLRTDISYLPDRNNTIRRRTMIMKVGSGAEKGANIHSHIVQKIWYLPANSKRTDIAWVRVKRVDGTTAEYVNPEHRDELAVIKKKLETRFMDCIDCHNRAAHRFDSFERMVDSAMTQGELDRTIPYLKREAIAVVPKLDRAPTDAEYAKALRKLSEIPSAYQKKYPEVYQARGKDIAKAAGTLRKLYQDSEFPHMRISDATYPNWATHEGCFRCHGVLVKQSGAAKETVGRDCLLCHTVPETSTGMETTKQILEQIR